MNTTPQSPVPFQFHGHSLFVIEHQGEPYTPMKPIVEGMGLDWASQFTKLKANHKRWGVVEITTPSRGGPQQQTCMPVRKLPGFLSTIHPNKVDPKIRGRVITFQNECDDALWAYWNGGRSTALPKPVRPVAGPVFTLCGHPVRVCVDADGKPWFSTRDFCHAVARPWNGTTLKDVPATHKATVRFNNPGPSGRQPMKAVDAVALPLLALESEVCSHRQLERWVAEVVLPGLRQAGHNAVRRVAIESGAPVAPVAPVLENLTDAMELMAARIEALEGRAVPEMPALALPGPALPGPALPGPALPDLNRPFYTAAPIGGGEWCTYRNTIGDRAWIDPAWSLIMQVKEMGFDVSGAVFSLMLREFFTTRAYARAKAYGVDLYAEPAPNFRHTRRYVENARDRFHVLPAV